MEIGRRTVHLARFNSFQPSHFGRQLPLGPRNSKRTANGVCLLLILITLITRTESRLVLYGRYIVGTGVLEAKLVTGYLTDILFHTRQCSKQAACLLIYY